jgi:UDP-glucose 4-epimerase
MSILLTGASGFIGRHVKNHLGNRCTPIYRYKAFNSSDKATNFFIKNIDGKTKWDGVFDNCSTVVHLAGLAHSASFTFDEYVEVNVNGTRRLAIEAAKAGVKRFIFLSSVNVCFLNNYDDPFSISYNLHSSFSKHLAEESLKIISQETSLEVVIIRLPLVYGEGVKANFAALLNLVSKKIPLPFGSIKENSRSLVSVYNLVDLIETCIHHPNAANQTFFVSDDHDLSTTEMVKLMAKVQGVKPWLLPFPVWKLKLLGKITGKSDMISRLTDSLQVDITHTKETLDWTPPYSVEEGFAKSVQIPRNKKTYL